MKAIILHLNSTPGQDFVEFQDNSGSQREKQAVREKYRQLEKNTGSKRETQAFREEYRQLERNTDS